MPVKRSRAGSSSAYMETSVAAAASVRQVKVMKTDAVAGPARPKFTVASPVKVDEYCDHMKFGEFLERCHFCKKRIDQNSEIFMYSNLCAFCSAGCRDIHQSAEKMRQNPKI